MAGPQGLESRWLARLAEQRRKMGRSIWLLLLLGNWAVRPDGQVLDGDSLRARDIGQALGIGERQARRDLRRLQRAGMVKLRNTGRGFSIQLLGSLEFVTGANKEVSLPRGRLG